MYALIVAITLKLGIRINNSCLTCVGCVLHRQSHNKLTTALGYVGCNIGEILQNSLLDAIYFGDVTDLGLSY